MLAGAAGMVPAGVSPWDCSHALWLLPVGLSASLGQWCMTRAYSHSATLVVASLQYCGLVFGALYGVTLLDEHIPLMGMGRHGSHPGQRHRRHGAARARGVR